MKTTPTLRVVAPRSRPLVEDFETRILYSADTPGGMMAAALQDPKQEVVQQVAARAPEALSATELVFIDSRVDHADRIEADIAAQAAAGRAIEAVVLDANQDGIAQITQALAGRNDVAAIHLISHGSEAAIELGSTTLDSSELLMRAGDIAAWGSHLKAGADLLVYGCDVAEGSDGQALVQGLAQLTGANVAASSDVTGNTALGADWTLEVQTGTIEAASALDAAGQAQWMGTLAANTSPRFGNVSGGSTTLDMGTANDMADQVLVQPDGKIILGGYTSSNFALARYQADGTLDTSFGTAGKVTTDFGATDVGNDMVLQADGKIVLAGTSNGDFAVARYNADGSLDSSFGTAGKTTINVNGTDSGNGVALQSDGKIVIVGYAHVGSFDAFAAVRLTTTGALDTTFNGTGKVTTAVGTGLARANMVAVQSDGKIVLSGTQVPNGGSYENTSLVRYNSDGSLDTTFNGSGIVIASVSTQTDAGGAVALQPDGKIVVVGWADSNGANGFDFSVLRFNTNGTLDTTFSGDGMLTTDFGANANGDYGWGVAIQPDGKIIATGDAYIGSYDFAVARYNSDGTPDTSFGTNGKATKDLTGNYDLGRAGALQSDGRIVVAGRTGASGSYNFGVARFNPDGTMDTGFAGASSTLDGTAAYTENSAAIVLDSSITLNDAELNSAGNYAGSTITLARSGGASSDDQFSASGSLSALTQGGNLVYAGTTIGTVTTNSAGTLLLTFNANATQARVNSALQSIAYLNSNDNPPAKVQINWLFNDGNTGAQGSGGALTGSGYTTVTITAANDAPTGTSNTVTTLEDIGYTFSAADFGFTDPDNGDSLSAVRIDALPAAGTLKLSGTAVTAAQVITAANIGNLVYTPAANASGTGYASFNFSVRDQGSAYDISPKTITFNVTALNDAPSGTANTVTTTEDTAYTFATADFGFSDANDSPANALLAVKISTLPAAGSLLLNGAAVSAGQSISAANIASGLLRFTPAANGNGLAYTSFTFQVQDDGGTANGGADTDPGAKTMTVNVTAVNDAPAFYTGGSGSVLTSQGTGQAYGNATVVQPDGKLIVVGEVSGSGRDFGITRYNADGSLDTSFNGSGSVTYAFGSSDDIPYSVALQADGKILVGGIANNADFGLIRLNTNGTLDTSFGSGGALSTDFYGSTDQVASLMVQSDGKIVAAGTVINGSSRDFGVARYNSDGSLDSSFGIGGKASVDVATGADDYAGGAALQSDGRIVIGGYSNNGGQNDFSVVRFNTNGTLDTGFGSSGKTFIDFGGSSYDIGRSVAIQADGKILIGGETHVGSTYDYGLARLTTAGVLDTTFNSTGLVVTDFSSNDDHGYAVAVQGDGRIVMTGSANVGGNQMVGTVRLLTDGSLDTGFGTSGKATTNLSSFNDEVARSIAIGSDGSVFVAGSVTPSAGGFNRFALVKYNSSGAISDTLGGSSTLANTVNYTEGNAPVVLAPAVSVSDAELDAAGNYAGATVSLARNGGANSVDTFSATGLLGALTQGAALTYNGTTLGTVTTNSGGTLLLTFNASATAALIDNALRCIALATNGPAGASQITMLWTINDGNSGAQGTGGAKTGTGTTIVNVTGVNSAPALTAIAPTMSSITEDQTTPAGQTVASFIGSSISDSDGSGQPQGIALTAASTTNGAWQYSLDGGSTWAAVGSVSATSALLLRSSDMLRFVPNAQNGVTATITYRAWDQSSGAAGSTADPSTNGGSTAYSTGTDTVSLVVTSVNDAPVLTPASPALTTITEDQTTNGGQLVSSFASSAITDVDSGAVKGIAITTTSSGTGTWQYSTNGGSSWTAVGAVSATSALLLRATDLVRFVPNGTAGTTASFGYVAWDQTSGSAGSKVSTASSGGSTAFSTAGDTASITVTAINDTPSFSSNGTGIAAFDFGTANDMATTVLVQPDGKIIMGGYTASDFALVRYQADGTLDTSFGTGGKVTTDFGSTDAANGMVLQADGKIVLAGTSNGNMAVARYNADGSLDTSFGSAGKTTIDVSGVDAGWSVALQADGKIVIGGSATVSSKGVFAAVRLTTSGALDTTFNGTGKVTTSMSSISSNAWSVLVQADGKIMLAGTASVGSYEQPAFVRYNSDGSLDTSWGGTGKVVVSLVNRDATDAIAQQADGKIVAAGHAWNGSNYDFQVLRFNTDGSLDTSFSGDGMQLTDFNGASNGDYAAGVAIQADGKIVVTGDADVNGSSNYDFAVARYNSDGSLDSSFGVGGKATKDFAGDYDYGAPMALQADGRIVVAGRTGASGAYNFGIARFNPDGSLDTSFNGTSTLNNTVTWTEGAAPVVLGSSAQVTDPELSAANNFAGASLTLARSGGANAQDVFSASGSLAALTEGGALVYGGTTIGTVTTNSAGTLLLTFNANATQALVNSAMQAIAYANSSDAPPASVQINWRFNDGNSGAQGSGGALSGSGYTKVTITAVNDAPVLTPAAPSLASITEDQTANAGQTVASFLGSSVSDPDGAAALQGIAITSTVNSTGTWQYSINAGSSWTAVGAVSNTSALLLRSSDLIRFVPDGNNGTTASVGYRAWDQTSGSAGNKVDTSANGGTSAFSSASDTATLVVASVNDAPVMAAAAPVLATITEDQVSNAGQTVASFIGASISDVDAGAVQGIAITGATLGNGAWQYSIDGGSTWQGLGSVSAASALLLRASDSIRFVPNAHSGTSASLSYRAWDQSSGTPGGNANTTTNGGTSPFSTQANTATLAVTSINDAPSGADKTVSTAKNTAYTFAAADFGFSDPNDSPANALAAVQITNLPSVGSLQLNGAAVAVNQLISAADIAAGQLQFVPAANGSGAPYASFAFKVQDDGGTANGGSNLDATARTMTIAVAATNHAPSFYVNADGKAVTDIDGIDDEAQALALQADGKLIVVGYADNGNDLDFALTRYNADGTLDIGFGTQGKVTTDFGGGDDIAYGVVVQADGKIVVTGYAHTGAIDQIAMARYNADGSLDASYGTGGLVRTHIGNADAQAINLVLLPNQQVLVAGYTDAGASRDFALLRYNSDGSLDTSFGNAGLATVDFGGQTDDGYSLGVQADGKIVMVGRTWNGTDHDVAMARFSSNGVLDTSFGTGGKVVVANGIAEDEAWAVVQQADGKLIVSGTGQPDQASSDFVINRFNADGSLDSTFGNGGRVFTAVGSSGGAGQGGAWGVSLQADGKIVAAGDAYNGSNLDFAVARYNSDGSLDARFGNGGIAIAPFASGSDSANGMLLTPDGHVVLAGFTQQSTTTSFGVARFNADGSLDSGWGNASIDNSVAFTENGAAAVLAAQAGVSDSELDAANNFAGASLSLARDGGANADDRFFGSGSLSALIEGGALTVSGAVIGTVTTNSNGTLLLSFNANATQALVNTALSSIAYANSNDTPPADVQIDWTFSDGNSGAQGPGGALSTTGFTQVDITATDDAPVLATSSGSAAFVEGNNVTSTPVVIDAGLTVTDPDNTTLASATVAITSGWQAGEDQLAFSNDGATMGDISGAFDAATGVLSLQSAGGATLAEWQAALRSVTYTNSSDTPDGTARTIRFIANDGSLDSAAATRSVTVTPVNDEQQLVTDAGLTVAENSLGNVIGTALLQTTDLDNTAAQLVYTTLTAPSHGTLKLNGVALAANGTFTQADIDAGRLTYDHDGSETSSDSFAFSADDGAGTATSGTFAITITPVNDNAPVITSNSGGASASTSVAENSTAVTTVTATDADLPAQTLSYSLSGTDAARFSIDSSTGVLRFVSAPNYEAPADANSDNVYQFTITASDGSLTTTQAMSVTVTDVNEAPTITSNGGGSSATVAVADFATAVTTVIATDPDLPAQSLTYSITGGADQTQFTIDATTGALRFNSAPNYAAPADADGDNEYLVTVQASDGSLVASQALAVQVAAPGTNSAPAFSNPGPGSNSDSTAYTERAAPVVIDANAAVVDSELGAIDNYAGASLSLTRHGTPDAQDVFSASGNLGALTEGGTLVLSGTVIGTVATNSAGKLVLSFGANATQAAVDETLRSIAYANTSHAPPNAVQLDWAFSDGNTGAQGAGGALTASGSSFITITQIDDAPSGADHAVTINEDASYTFTDPSVFGFSDPDAGDALSGVRIDTLPGAGSLRLSGVAVTAGQTISAANLPNLVYTSAPNGNGTAYAGFSFSVRDGAGVYAAASSQFTVNVTSVNDAPSGTSTTVTTNEDAAYTFALADFGYSDANDSPANNFASVRIGTISGAGSLTLAGTAVAAGQTLSAAAIGSGQLKFTPAANANGNAYAGFTFQVRDDGGTANGGVDLDPTLRTLTVDVASANDAPSGTSKTVTTNEDTAYVFAASDFGFSDPNDSPANALLAVKVTSLPAAGGLTLNGTAVAAAQLVSVADINAGLLRFTPVANANGAGYASFNFRVQDDGGTAGGGVDLSAPRTLTVNVSAVNDAPVATIAAASYSATEQVSIALQGTGLQVSDVDAGGANVQVTISAAAGKVSAGPGTTGVTVTNSGTGSVTLSGSLAQINALLAGTAHGLVSYVMNADAPPATDTLTLAVNDLGNSGSGGALSSSASVAINIAAVNDAPLLSPIAPGLVPITEDQTANGGQTVASFIGSSISDPDGTSLQGIAINAAVAANGNWQFSLDGGATWTALGTVSDASARLLRASDLIRFVPDAMNGGTVSLGYRAWDQTSGTAGALADASTNGGATAFSLASDTATLAVASVNDAPVLTASLPSLDPITEDQLTNAGQTVASLLGASLGDVDNGAVQGIAIVSNSNGGAAWQYSLDNGTSWLAMPAASTSAALLLRAGDLVRFVPDGHNGTTASLVYTGWDQSSGTAGSTADVTTRGGSTAFSSATDTATIDVAAVNDAPVLAPIAPVLATIDEDALNNAGQTVASFIGSSISDVDSSAVQGIVITGSVNGNGAWQFSLDSGSSWNALGTASDSAGVLLRASDLIRFVPDGRNGTAGSITYRAWDQSTGAAGSTADAQVNGGTSAFSSGSDTASITVTSVNDAPVLTPIAPVLATITEDQTANGGQTVASFIGASINDVDSGALQGIAITGSTAGNGAWQFSIDGGAAWTALGTTSDSAALLLRTSDLIRFVPDGRNGATATLSYRAWDQTTGAAGGTVDASSHGGSTAFSAATDGASMTVLSVNDAPSGASTTVTTLEDWAYHFEVADFGFSDAGDTPANNLQAVIVTTLPASGNLQLDGVAVSANQSIAAADIAAGRLAFTPAANSNGPGDASFTFRVQDDGGTANGGIDTDPLARTMTIDVTAVNDAPSGASHTVTAIEDQSLTFTAADFGFSDANDSPANGMLAVHIASLPEAGSLRLNGAAVTAGQSIAASDIASGLLVFTPAANDNGAGYASFGFRVQDDGDTAHGGVDLDAATRAMTIDVTAVNDAPVLAPISPSLATITEDQTDNAGQTVASFIGGSISDVDDGAARGIAITATVNGSGTWQYSIDAGTSWSNVGGASASTARLLRASDLVRFVPDGQNATAGSISYRAWDRTSGTAGGKADTSNSGGAAAFSTAADTASITITAVNDAPRGSNNTVTTAEDRAYVFSATDFGFSDPTDSPANALLAVTINTLPAAGSLRLSGVAVSAGQRVTAAEIGAGLLRFAPAANANGAATASFGFRVQDDGGTANGGLDLDPIVRTMTVDVSAVNDAPAGSSRSVSTSENTPYRFGSADFGFSDASDSPANALLSVTITTLPGAGSLSLNGVAVSAGQSIAAADIDAGLLRFTPALNANGASYASFTFQVRDDGGTANGGIDLDPTARLMTIDVGAVNQAPVLAPVGPVMGTITEDQTSNAGQTVASFIGNSISDADNGALQGIAVTATVDGNGHWQFSTDGGVSWANLGAASVSSARLLRSNDLLRFVPNGQNATAGSIGYRAWDQSSGAAGSTANTGVNGGTSAFSTATDIASLTVTAVNDAPVLTAVSPALPALNEDQTTNGGQTVASFIGGSIGDVDSGALQGIAITAATSGDGRWQFSIDGGSSWGNVGAVSDTAALLLRSSDLLRFVPDGQNGTAGSITYCAWDQTSGTTGSQANATGHGGTTAFSANSDNASISVGAVNDAPVLASTAPTLTNITEDQTANAGQTVASVIGGSISDVDSGAVQGIAITETTNGNGRWQYSIDGGNSWSNVGTTTATNALLLRSTDALRFVPNGQNGTAGSITYCAWDQTSGTTGSQANATGHGGTTAFSANSDTATLTVIAVNDAPQGADHVVTTTEDTSYVFDPADFRFSDPVDSPPNHLLAVTIATLPGAGSLRLNGVAVSAGQSIAAADIGAGLLQFAPALHANGPAYASFMFQVQDDGGTASGGLDLDPTPRLMTIDVGAVDQAPVLTPFGPALTSITEDQTANAGQTVASIIGGSITDVDGGALQGIAITATLSGHGDWQYSIDGGGAWRNVEGVGASSALLLRAGDLVRFVPDGQNATAGSMTYRAWDQTRGAAGDTADTRLNGGTTAFSSASDTASINVTSVDDAPQGTNRTVATPQDTAYVFSIADFGFSDPIDSPANDLLSVTIARLPSAGALSLNGVAVSAGQRIGAADIDAGRLQFAPGLHASGAGYATFDFQLQDDGGTAHGGSDLDPVARRMTIDVTAVNRAPVLTPIAPTLASIPADRTAPAGQSVASFIGHSITDADSGALSGIAIFATHGGPGRWQSSIDAGGHWSDIGSVSDSAALLLRAGDWLRFVPDGQSGAAASLGYRAWDQTDGSAGGRASVATTGGHSAFSTATDTATLAVVSLPVPSAPANTPPVITSDGGGDTASVVFTGPGRDVTTVTATDADLPAQTLGYFIAGGADAAQFSIDARSGVLQFRAQPPLALGVDQAFTLVVGVGDGFAQRLQTLIVLVPRNPVAPLPSPGAPVTQAPSASSAAASPPTAPAVARPAVTATDPAAGMPLHLDPLEAHLTRAGVVLDDAALAARPLWQVSPTRLYSPLVEAPLLHVPSIEITRPQRERLQMLHYLLQVRSHSGREEEIAAIPHIIEPAEAALPALSAELTPGLVGGLAASVGLLAWASRGGALLASLLVSAPAWRSFDLLPVLRQRDRAEDEEEPPLDDRQRAARWRRRAGLATEAGGLHPGPRR